MPPVTLSDVERFVATLEPEYQRVFGWARDEARARDTLGNEVQVAARIERAFWDQAQHLMDVALEAPEKEVEDG